MCFNGVKNSLLGWYNNRKLRVDPFAGPVKVNLAAFVDYNKTTTAQPVLVKVGAYVLQFNRAKTFNENTQAKADQVTVTAPGTYYSRSVAGLAVGDRFIVKNFQRSGRRLIIQACRRVWNSASDIDTMVLSIGIGASYCSASVQTSDLSLPPSCRPLGTFCSSNAHCCDALKCVRRAKNPSRCAPCRKKQRQCVVSNDCCDSLTCSNQKCV